MHVYTFCMILELLAHFPVVVSVQMKYSNEMFLYWLNKTTYFDLSSLGMEVIFLLSARSYTFTPCKMRINSTVLTLHPTIINVCVYSLNSPI